MMHHTSTYEHECTPSSLLSAHTSHTPHTPPLPIHPAGNIAQAVDLDVFVVPQPFESDASPRVPSAWDLATQKPGPAAALGSTADDVAEPTGSPDSRRRKDREAEKAAAGSKQKQAVKAAAAAGAVGKGQQQETVLSTPRALSEGSAGGEQHEGGEDDAGYGSAEV